jgi:2-polyprenyl-6-hydroxyphenyl methylase/3-demethylubiquinone-9 3-methyltransferase
MSTRLDTPESYKESAVSFQFGQNWSRFLSTLDEQRIQAAIASVQKPLHRNELTNMTFLDAGSGSGLFSLAAHRLGAIVTSFDADADSVACTAMLKQRYASENRQWQVLSGSLLDSDFIRSLGMFDVVYCWGVAHHTGEMWTAIDHLIPAVAPGGLIVLAIYNDQLYISRAWDAIKRSYQKLPKWLRPSYVFAIGSIEFLKRLAVTLVACALRLVTFRNPITPVVNWLREQQTRGMHGWYDLVDWVGGWPFEVARPEEIFRFMRDRGFVLQELTTSMGHGCNEYVFQRNATSNLSSIPGEPTQTWLGSRES